jgi:NADPH:quinone reductase-like Zn-dependent oxidoreductase
MKAAAANPMDWKLRRGEMKMLSGSRFPRGLGHDFAGVVESLGPGVERLKVGDEVFGATSIASAGAFSDFVVADEKDAVIKPASISFVEAAALPVVSVTAWNGLVVKAKVREGNSVFIAGCLGSVGRSAVQIARSRRATIAGSCSVSGREEALELGANEVMDYQKFDPSQFRNRYDVVFDTAGALSLSQCSTMLKPGGVSLHIVPTAAKMLGCTLSRRHNLVFGTPSPAALKNVAEAAERKDLAPVIGSTVPLNEAIAALARLETAGLPKGKLVVTASPT